MEARVETLSLFFGLIISNALGGPPADAAARFSDPTPPYGIFLFNPAAFSFFQFFPELPTPDRANPDRDSIWDFFARSTDR